jgi:hypothetical protein
MRRSLTRSIAAAGLALASLATLGGALVDAAMELHDNGTSTYLDRALPHPLRDAAFG